MASRSLFDLVAPFRERVRQLIIHCGALGIRLVVTCTARSFREQVALYAQGRQPLNEVNELRKIVGLPPITEEQNKTCITWTLKSKHIINIENDDVNDDFAYACDVAIVKPGTRELVWDIKADTNNDNMNDWEQVGIEAEKLGITWGGRWKNPDRPHLQWDN